MADKKYYWLKLKDNFFEQEDIRLVEGMKNGKDYIIFLLKLQLKSINTGGYLLYKNTIPYSEDMLATITNTDVDIVRNALRVYLSLGIMERLDNGALFMEEVEKLIGAETEWAGKKREWRNKQIPEDNVLKLSSPSPDRVRQEIDKEKEIDKDNNSGTSPQKKNFSPPTLEEVKAYCKERDNKVNAEKWYDFYISKGWMIGKNKMRDWKAAVRTWEDNGKTPQKNKFNNIEPRQYQPDHGERFIERPTTYTDDDIAKALEERKNSKLNFNS